MLIEFRVGNFRSFHEPQTFSLVAGPDAKHPDNLIPCGKVNLLKSAAVYGANASGKSNLIKALSLMRAFVRYSATRMNIGDEIPVEPFRLAAESSAEASLFEAVFSLNGVRHDYGFTATRERVEDEWLTAYPQGKPQRWFERRFQHETQETTWTFRGPLRRAGPLLLNLLRERTRVNGLVVSRGAELNIPQLVDVFVWFDKGADVLDLSGSLDQLTRETAARVKADPAVRERVLKLIRHADFGIDDLEVSESQPTISTSGTFSTLPNMGSLVPYTGISGTIASSPFLSTAFSFVPIFTIRSLHRAAGIEGGVLFDFLHAESNGTQRFFALAGPFLDALDRGALLVIDELDCSMHPNLTWKLIELFQAPGVNTRGAQLVFSTHDNTLMHPELFRRDQIWIVDKNHAGASRLSSVYDFEEKPRGDAAFGKNYLAGRYGGVPVLGRTFEDLELK